MKYPCKQCISYAMCISRELIICNTLLDSIENMNEFNWTEINKILPEVYSIQYESRLLARIKLKERCD